MFMFWDNIPERSAVWINRVEGQHKDYGWWPVGIVRLEDAFIKLHGLPRDVLYITCIFQALDVDVVAWAMKVTNQLEFETIADWT